MISKFLSVYNLYKNTFFFSFCLDYIPTNRIQDRTISDGRPIWLQKKYGNEISNTLRIIIQKNIWKDKRTFIAFVNIEKEFDYVI